MYTYILQRANNLYKLYTYIQTFLELLNFNIIYYLIVGSIRYGFQKSILNSNLCEHIIIDIKTITHAQTHSSKLSYLIQELYKFNPVGNLSLLSNR